MGDAELLYFLDDLPDNGVFGVLDGHDEDRVALSLGGDSVEPALQGLDASLLIVGLRLLRAELVDAAEELLEVRDGDGAFRLVLRGLVSAEAHDGTEGERVEARGLGSVQCDYSIALSGKGRSQ